MAKKPLFKIIPDSIIKAGGRGYQYCQTDPPHPNGMVLGDRKARYVYLHIAKMELSIGRFIRKGEEEVHHKDGDVSNNALSNLELKKAGEHQRDHANDKQMWKKSPRTQKRKASDHLRRIAKCLCQITDVGSVPAVDQVHGTIIIDRACPDHKEIGREGQHSEHETETSIKPKMLPDRSKKVACQYLSEITCQSSF